MRVEAPVGEAETTRDVAKHCTPRRNSRNHGSEAAGRRARPRRRSRPDALRLWVAFERITVDPGRMGGLPCIRRDLRVTVSAVVGQLAAGRSVEEVLADYPHLDRADVLAALEFAAAAVSERELPLAAPA
jgi:uncharacterized protein (DUF433 family)